MPLIVMLRPFNENGSGPKGLIPETTPVSPGARPVPTAVASPHGTRPTAPLAALVKLVAVSAGPGGRDVSVALAETVPAVAVITMFPAVVPAVTVVAALPCESVAAEAGLTVALPEDTVKLTATPGTTLLLTSRTWKVIGCGKV